MIDFGDTVWGPLSPRYVRGWCSIVQSTWFIKLFVYFYGVASGIFSFAFAISHEEFLESQDFAKRNAAILQSTEGTSLSSAHINVLSEQLFFHVKKCMRFGKVMQSWTVTESPSLLARVEVTLQTQWEQEKLTFHILTFFSLGAKQKGQEKFLHPTAKICEVTMKFVYKLLGLQSRV